ncbi:MULTISPECIES: GlsB/YeaQ/YmgE family stress response membrane protein [Erythrobacter]|uniref:GlsB/YeaQ/YmgE family stress response membrane protein n=1 Tax=Erythrobacter aureus TaxID=2182384 RepID=A0A345YBY6_9SPHN|nr:MULTISPECIES: GlsB/YeaQ/YmgE family stress response membrane protein [Erythrobacter]AXK41438.1 GlsB/YeaQ/YmgE family stress response membrane protein [Erythrobacter aureus]MBL45857.1 GlsB/YeaQ/YmgE family stress response membrane protein [Sphingomonadaceae bacterium]MBQ95018.1 GlsB/YeaQ/YmgE family stress response membrane protein [Actinomycetota bacterium]MCF8883065.1 GlsB/YeaQ/YmgE family stress response membrane protein [Erythrobacter sp. SN021]|tara:strand:- start:537 stop:800 length:264 start_codon:yes stop_codon:yes gene_type:complete
MAWIIAIIVGGIIGWLASLVMNRDASMGIFWNIVVGIVGSFIGKWIGSLIGVGATLTEFSVPGLLMSLLGAIVLLGIANMVQRGRVR